jgi:hypothetical protein
VGVRNPLATPDGPACGNRWQRIPTLPIPDGSDAARLDLAHQHARRLPLEATDPDVPRQLELVALGELEPRASRNPKKNQPKGQS